MGTTLDKPHLLSWMTIPILLFVGFVFNQHTIDIQLHNTYWVISNIHFVLAASLLLLLIGTGYWLVKLAGKSIDRTLAAIHLLLTVSVLLLFALPVSEYDLGLSTWLVWSVLALSVAQLIYLTNIFISLMRNRKAL